MRRTTARRPSSGPYCLARQRRPDLKIHILKWIWGGPSCFGRGDDDIPAGTLGDDEADPVQARQRPSCNRQPPPEDRVIDDKLAFCWRHRMTASRWDTRSMKDGDKGGAADDRPGLRPLARHDGGGRRCGAALGRLSRERWKIACAGSDRGAATEGESVAEALERIPDRGRRRDRADARGASESEGSARDRGAVRRLIAGARRFANAENHSSPPARSPRRREAARRPDGPEFVPRPSEECPGWV